ncbi:hypothetical protein PSPO_b1422 [Pseudoalteromonas spongiae UST010723-006]|nr:hypothetical protein PSPO_b1422 [Pseudoalteromonas spongiae UST010723-006]
MSPRFFLSFLHIPTYCTFTNSGFYNQSLPVTVSQSDYAISTFVNNVNRYFY